MKTYFYAVVLSSDEEKLFACDFEVSIDDYIVVDNGYLEPETAKVTKLVDKLKAVASKRTINEVIDLINTKPYLAHKLAEAEKDNIIEMMKKEAEVVKLRDTLDKYSGKSERMRELAEILEGIEKADKGQGN